MATLLAHRETLVRPDHRMFAVHDPTCDEGDDFRPATVEAIGSVVGWAPSVVSVSTMLDLVRVTVRVEVWSGPPAGDDAAELVREGDVAFPSGRYGVDMSIEEDVRLGVEFPPGPGTYRVRVSGYRRAEVRQRRDAAYAAPPGTDVDAAIDALDGLETYLFQLWHVDPLPRYEEDDD